MREVTALPNSERNPLCLTISNPAQPITYNVPHILLDVENRPTLTMLDTGSSITAISLDKYNELRQQRHLPLNKSVKSIRAANNTLLRSVGLTTIRITLNGRHRKTEVEVIPDFPFELLIGWPQLQRWEMSLNAIKKSVTLANQIFPILRSSKQKSPTSNIKSIVTTERVRLPPSCGLRIPTSIIDHQPGQHGIITTDPTLLEKAPIFVARGVPVVDDSGNTEALAANLGDEDIIIPKNTQIAVFSALSPDEYTTHNLGDVNNILDLADEPDADIKAKIQKWSSEPTNSDPPIEGLDLSNSVLSNEQRDQLHRVLQKMSDRFVLNNQRPGRTDLVEMDIDTGDALPTNQAPYPRGPAHREFIEKTIDENLEGNIIRPSFSPWASPVVIIRKKDNYFRFAIDYRKLNSVTKREIYPMPRVDDTLDALNGVKYMSTLDLASGYWSVPIREEDKQKTAFITHKGLYEYNFMPYGLSNAPAVFSCLMDAVTAGLKWQSVLTFIDDIFVYSKTFDDHLIHLVKLFERLRKANLTTKPSKCHFCRPKLI